MSTKDDKCMITKETSNILRKRLFEPGAHRGLNDSFAEYLKTEPYAARDISKVLFAYDKIIVSTCFQAFAQDGNVPEEFVNAVSKQVKQFLECTFAAGVMYGRARIDQEFIVTVKDLVENQKFVDMDKIVNEQLKNIDNPQIKPQLTKDDFLSEDDDDEGWLDDEQRE